MSLTDGTTRDELSLAGEAALGGIAVAVLLQQPAENLLKLAGIAAACAPGIWYCLRRTGFWQTLTAALGMFAAVAFGAIAVSSV